MYVIFSKTNNTYYTGSGWTPSMSLALKYTKLRAEELIDSFNKQSSFGWIVGDFEMVGV